MSRTVRTCGNGFLRRVRFRGRPKKQTAIFDPDTGKLLAYEEMLTEDADELNVRVPSVTEYTTHLSSSYPN
ncbi:hypothetical protein ABT389_33725 [Streptomyces bacillaris]|uniref:hypothetical protein n=1 Tax=Streptomyces bacillaris TaxID=68179 RepID=UPI003356AA41